MAKATDNQPRHGVQARHTAGHPLQTQGAPDAPPPHHRRASTVRHCAQLIALSAGLLSTLTAHAAIEAGGWEVNHWSDDNIQFSIYQLPNQQDVTFLYAQVSHDTATDGSVSHTLQGLSFTLDSAAVIYSVNEGDNLSNALFDSGAYIPLVGATSQTWASLTVHGTDTFWLGAQTREGNAGTQPWTGLGWAARRRA